MSLVPPASRAVGRWSLRLFRREWRQQLLILAMLAIAVAAAVTFATVAVKAASQAGEPFGGANARIRLAADDPAVAARTVEAIKARFGEVDVTAHSSVTVPGAVDRLGVRDQDPDGVYSHRLLDLRSGRYPAAAGEVALTDGAADLLGAHVGSAVTLGRQSATVVGLVEDPAKLSEDFALVAPGTLSEPDQIVVLVDRNHDRGPTPGANSLSFEIAGSDSGRAQAVVLVLVTTTLALALVGLLAAAAFVVVAQRRQRQLGMLVAIGATDRQVRLVMLATGAITGVVAAAVGAALGVAGWFVLAPAAESAADHRISRTDLPWSLIVAEVLLAVVAATLAAWWPARVASRLPVMAALSGRPAAPRPVHRPLLVALVLLAGGVTAIAIADPLGKHPQYLLLVGGLVAVVVGTVFATPAAIRAGGRLARRLPFAPRVALRDLARYQARAAAALGAITLGLAMSIGIVAVAAAAVPPPTEGNLSDHELVLTIGSQNGDGTEVSLVPNPDMTAAEVAALDRRAADVVATLGDGVSTAPLDVAISTRPTPDGSPHQPVEMGVDSGPHSISGRGVPYVATDELLALYGIDPQSIDPGTELITSRHEPFLLLDFTTRPDAGGRDPVADGQIVDLPTYGSAPNALITEAAMAEHDWKSVRSGWIVESPTAFTQDQIRAARLAAANVGLRVEAREVFDGLAALRTGATIAGGVLAVAIVAISVGLIRTEARREVQTLTATGARGRTRRALTATTAAGLAVPGVVLGLTGAYVALVASYHADLGRLVPVPLAQLVPLAVGTPLAAAAVGWLLAGREPRSFARQELE